MNNDTILQTALLQSAYDCNCTPADFMRDEPIITRSKAHPFARKYIPLPLACDMVSYGRNVVAQTSEDTEAVVREYLQSHPTAHCFETPNIHLLDEKLQKNGLKICFMAEYFLPNVTRLVPRPCPYEMRLLHQEDFSTLYLPEWSNALCTKRKELDVLGIGAYDGDRLIGLAACSADCESMYQIGIDVLPAYRHRGIAAALTSHLALHILALGKVPFYCAAWCNIPSVRNALACGFFPAWVELTARESSFVEQLNHPMPASIGHTQAG